MAGRPRNPNIAGLWKSLELLTMCSTILEVSVSVQQFGVRSDKCSLAAVLAAEDDAEDYAGLSPHERITCRVHLRWAHKCIASPVHVIPVTGHRWCRRCRTSTSVAVDELSATVTLTCIQCGEAPVSRATLEIIRTCRASMRAARVSNLEGE
jgi:hypothetical protein